MATWTNTSKTADFSATNINKATSTFTNIDKTNITYSYDRSGIAYNESDYQYDISNDWNNIIKN